jgi:hypothetical protein
MRQLQDLRHHCAALGRLLNEVDAERWSHAADWLRVASGIDAVNLKAASLDPAFGWCSGADEYAIAQDEIAESLVRHLAMFMFVWGMLESVIDELRACLPQGRGKLHRAALFLERRFAKRQSIDPYETELERLCTLIRERPDDARHLEGLRAPALIGGASIGLRIVYRIRNNFAHGAMRIPIPDSDHHPQFHESHIVECATRIVLLSTQMLIAAVYDGSDSNFDSDGDGFGVDDETVGLEEALKRIHLEVEDDTDQPLLEW